MYIYIYIYIYIRDEVSTVRKNSQRRIESAAKGFFFVIILSYFKDVITIQRKNIRQIAINVIQ